MSLTDKKNSYSGLNNQNIGEFYNVTSVLKKTRGVNLSSDDNQFVTKNKYE